VGSSVRWWALVVLGLSSAASAGDWGKDSGSSGSPAWGKSDTVASGKRLSVDAPIVIGDLALYPVIDREADGQQEVDVTTLGPAMRSGQVRIHESASGSVDELALVNRGDEPVLVVAGDVVHGGMQDRVVQRTQLVAAGSAVRLPVLCVEQGRWTDRYDGQFAYAGRVDPAIRAVVREGSQDATWSAVAEVNRERGISESASWLAGRSLDRQQLAEAQAALMDRFEDDKRIVGVVVAQGGQFTGSEVYPHPELFVQDHLQVLSSHLVAKPTAARPEAIARRELPSTTDAAAYLELALAD
jgi:hypothetical protein